MLNKSLRIVAPRSLPLHCGQSENLLESSHLVDPHPAIRYSSHPRIGPLRSAKRIVRHRGFQDRTRCRLPNRSRRTRGGRAKAADQRARTSLTRTYLALVNVLMLIFAVEFRLAEVALILPMGRQSAPTSRHPQRPRHPCHSVGALEKSQDTAIPDIPQVRSERRVRSVLRCCDIASVFC